MAKMTPLKDTAPKAEYYRILEEKEMIIIKTDATQ
jgi:hypothetical protein